MPKKTFILILEPVKQADRQLHRYYFIFQINAMASILILETLGKDTSSQLYTIEHDFEALKSFTLEVINIGSEYKTGLNWTQMLNISEDSEAMKAIRSKLNITNEIMLVFSA